MYTSICYIEEKLILEIESSFPRALASFLIELANVLAKHGMLNMVLFLS